MLFSADKLSVGFTHSHSPCAFSVALGAHGQAPSMRASSEQSSQEYVGQQFPGWLLPLLARFRTERHGGFLQVDKSHLQVSATRMLSGGQASTGGAGSSLSSVVDSTRSAKKREERIN